MSAPDLNKPLRVAIIGTGPSGMYAVEHLLGHDGLNVEIDLYERLPVPWGLVRYGVAPDHPEKKLVSTRLFKHLINRDNVRFFGNIEIGKDIQTSDILQWYDSVIFASGATSDNKLNIPGEDLSGSWAAREFVAWYNGHPDYSDLDFNLSCKRAVIVGNGNVALDVARILCMPLEELEKTDIAEHALNALRKSAIKEVVILGRRSSANAAYNNPELEELAHLDDVEVTIDDPNFEAILSTHIDQLSWENGRKVKTLKALKERSLKSPSKRIIFKFASSPVEIMGDKKVESLTLAANKTEITKDGAETVLSSGATSTLDTGLVLRAIGYKGQAFPGLPFADKRAIIENSDGRITKNGQPVTGAYVTGWIKRGPRGVIGTNKQCSQQTIHALLDDYENRQLDAQTTLSSDEVLSEVKARQPNFVPLSGWLAIDRAEQIAGRSQNRKRKKICNVAEMLQIANA